MSISVLPSCYAIANKNKKQIGQMQIAMIYYNFCKECTKDILRDLCFVHKKEIKNFDYLSLLWNGKHIADLCLYFIFTGMYIDATARSLLS